MPICVQRARRIMGKVLLLRDAEKCVWYIACMCVCIYRELKCMACVRHAAQLRQSALGLMRRRFRRCARGLSSGDNKIETLGGGMAVVGGRGMKIARELECS